MHGINNGSTTLIVRLTAGNNIGGLGGCNLPKWGGDKSLPYQLPLPLEILRAEVKCSSIH